MFTSGYAGGFSTFQIWIFYFPYMNFNTIGDCSILICYYLKLLKVSKTEIKAFIREFEKIRKEYENSVNSGVSSITILPDLTSRMTILKNSF